MRSFALALALAILAGQAAPARAQSGTVEELFDGRSLAGWRGDTSYWSVADGVLTGQSTDAHPCTQTQYLVSSAAPVGDFELTLEFRLVGGNSGVQFRSRGEGPYDIAGYQADLEDGPNWSGCLYEQEGRGVIATRGQLVSYDEQGARTLIPFADGAELLARVRPREWNSYRIRAVGPRIDLALNGWTTATLIDRDPVHGARSGCLALQLHQGAPMLAQFRNLRLVRLDRPAAPREQSSWIWGATPAPEGAQVWLGTRFELPARTTRVLVRGAADNAFTAEIDGQFVLAGDEWEHPVKDEIESGLGAGTHTLELHASNQGGPAGAWFELEAELADGSSFRLASDGRWRASDEQPPADWLAAGAGRSATVLGPIGCEPWGTPPAAVDYQAGGALAAEALGLPPGFAAELVYSVPKALQGSWVALAFDPQGRLYASDQYGALYRVTLARPGPGVDSVERVALELGEAHGLLWAFDALYAVVTRGARYETGLYRARDSDGDDRLDALEQLARFDGPAGEHGPHAIALGPDGRSLYVLAGNHTDLPAPLVSSRVPQLWGEDLLLPRREDPRGHAVGIRAPGGWLARTDAEAREWELVAAGMRNAYDFDFDAEGEAFTFDSDMEWDLGLPWYRPARVLHLVPGAEFGWRSGSSNFPAWFPDSLPAAADVGLGSPTGVAFARGSRFPAPWRERLFVGDWAYGRILAVELDPAGSSWSGSWQVFASGHPLPVTDLLFGPDGALYFASGGRRASSGLYRVRWTGAEDSPRAAPAAGLSERQRRRALERADEAPDSAALAAEDPFLRHAARTALERSTTATRVAALERAGDPRAQVECLLALIRADGPREAPRIWAGLERLPLERMSPEPRREGLRAWMLALVRAGVPPARTADAMRVRFTRLFPGPDLETDRVLLDLLVKLEEPAVVAAALELAERASGSASALAYAWPLRVARAGWTPALRARYFAWMNRAEGLWSGGASFTGYLRNLREDALAGMSADERRALGALAEIPAAPRVAGDGPPPAIVARWNESAIVPLLARLGEGRSFEQGERAFSRARCLECHRIAGAGGNRGPDLTGAGARYSSRDLLEAILRPSAAITDQYGETQVVTEDERLVVGRVEREDATTLVLHCTTPVEESITLAKAEIESRRASPVSAMPEGLLDVLNEDELLDLFAYVLAGARRDAPAFR